MHISQTHALESVDEALSTHSERIDDCLVAGWSKPSTPTNGRAIQELVNREIIWPPSTMRSVVLKRKLIKRTLASNPTGWKQRRPLHQDTRQRCNKLMKTSAVLPQRLLTGRARSQYPRADNVTTHVHGPLPPNGSDVEMTFGSVGKPTDLSHTNHNTLRDMNKTTNHMQNLPVLLTRTIGVGRTPSQALSCLACPREVVPFCTRSATFTWVGTLRNYQSVSGVDLFKRRTHPLLLTIPTEALPRQLVHVLNLSWRVGPIEQLSPIFLRGKRAPPISQQTPKFEQNTPCTEVRGARQQRPFAPQSRRSGQSSLGLPSLIVAARAVGTTFLHSLRASRNLEMTCDLALGPAETLYHLGQHHALCLFAFRLVLCWTTTLDRRMAASQHVTIFLHISNLEYHSPAADSRKMSRMRRCISRA